MDDDICECDECDCQHILEGPEEESEGICISCQEGDHDA